MLLTGIDHRSNKHRTLLRPFTPDDIVRTASHFGIHADWMLPPAGARGTIYTSDGGQRSHRPTIFVDETNRVLYFEMSD